MDARVAKGMRTIRTLWFALLPSNLIFVALLANGFGAKAASSQAHAMAPMLGALAAGIAVLSFFLPARIFAIALRSAKIAVSEEAGEGLGGFRQATLAQKTVARPTETVLDALARWRPTFLIGMALAESISLFGLMVGFLGAPALVYLPFIAAGLAIMLVKYPRLETVTSAIERASGAKLKL